MTREHHPPRDASKTTSQRNRPAPPAGTPPDHASAPAPRTTGATEPAGPITVGGADDAGATAPAAIAPAAAAAPSVAAPAPTDDAWALVGVITGAFGLHGDLKVRPETDFPERFARTKTLYVGDERTPYPVASARPHKVGQLVIHLTGVESEPEAERLRNRQIYIPIIELTPLAPQQYYIHDLIGLRVEHVNGTPLGVITDVITTAASDLYVIRPTPAPGADPKTTGSGHGKAKAKASDDEVMLPAVKEFVKSISLARGVITVDPIPGLFDENSVNAAEDVDAEGEGS